MDNHLFIRQATLNDLPTIADLAKLSWWEHYPGIISDEQIRFMLSKGYGLEALHTQLTMHSQTFFIAYYEGKPMAYAAYTQKTDGRVMFLYLNKLYAVQEGQGIGMGKALLNVVKDEAHKRGILRIRLNVNRFNPTVAWYKRKYPRKN